MMKRISKRKYIPYGDHIPEIGSVYELKDCLLVIQKSENSSEVYFLITDGNGTVMKSTPEEAFALNSDFESFKSKTDKTLDTKLDKGDYDGTASDLKQLIDNSNSSLGSLGISNVNGLEDDLEDKKNAIKLLTTQLNDAKRAIDTKLDKGDYDGTASDLNRKIDNVMAFLNSPDDALDHLDEIVHFIKQNEESLSNLGVNNIRGLQEALDTKLDNSEFTSYKESNKVDINYLKDKAVANSTEINKRVTTSDFNIKVNELLSSISTKVDQESGKSLTSNDFTNELKTILENAQHWRLTTPEGKLLDGDTKKSFNIDKKFDSGFYYVYAPTGTLPVTYDNWYGLYVFPGKTTDNSVGCLQLFFSLKSNQQIYYRIQRGYSSVDWSSWRRVMNDLDDGNLSSKDQEITENRFIRVATDSRLSIRGLEEIDERIALFTPLKALVNPSTGLEVVDISDWQKYSFTNYNGNLLETDELDFNNIRTPGYYFSRTNMVNSPDDSYRWQWYIWIYREPNGRGVLQLTFSNPGVYYRLIASNGSLGPWVNIVRPEDIEVLSKSDTTITFERDADYGDKRNPLSTFSIDTTNAKRGVTNLIFFNGPELPNSGVDWSHTNDFFIPNTLHKIILTYVEGNTILGNIL